MSFQGNVEKSMFPSFLYKEFNICIPYYLYWKYSYMEYNIIDNSAVKEPVISVFAAEIVEFIYKNAKHFSNVAMQDSSIEFDMPITLTVNKSNVKSVLSRIDALCSKAADNYGFEYEGFKIVERKNIAGCNTEDYQVITHVFSIISEDDEAEIDICVMAGSLISSKFATITIEPVIENLH